jgi:hypothetical protein
MKDVLRNDTVRQSADDEGGKGSWQRTVESVPSSEDRDPKTNEERRGDYSFRRGPFGRRRPANGQHRFE